MVALGGHRTFRIALICVIEELSEDVHPEYAHVHNRFPCDRSNGIWMVSLRDLRSFHGHGGVCRLLGRIFC